MPAISRFSPGGPARMVYVRAFTDANIWKVATRALGTPSSSQPVVTIASTRLDVNPQFSPDGRRVAFGSTRSGGWEVWVSDPDGVNSVQLTTMGSPVTGVPRWSPDGKFLAFHSDREGQFEIYLMPSSGGKPRRLTSHSANDEDPSFSSDGRWIYFASNRTGVFQIWKVPVSGGDPIQVTQNTGTVAFESKDGTSLYYAQNSPGAPSPLWRLATTGGLPVKLLERISWQAFAVLERGIYYLDRTGDSTQLEYFNFDTSRSSTVARNLGNVRLGLTAPADGRTILYTRVDSAVEDLMLVENFQ